MKKLMLDTHVLLWAIGKSDELSPRVFKYLTNSANEVYISAVTIWEITLKRSVGKLKLPQNENHKDPFDRMLIYQCIRRNYTLISNVV